MAGKGSDNTNTKCPICGGVGYFRVDVPIGHPDFGRAIPCLCTLERMPEKERTKATGRKSKRVVRRSPAAKADRIPAFKQSPQELTDFSYSGLATFQQCPRRFMLRYLADENTDSGRDREHAIGSAVHGTLYAFMRKNAGERTPGLLEALFDKYWEAYWKGLRPSGNEKEQWELTVWESLSRFYDAGNCAGRPRDLEKHFAFQLDESITITGDIDRIDNIGESDYELIDYKALEPPFTGEQALRDLQTILYYHGAKSIYDERPPVRISYLFVHQGAVVSVSPTPEEMQEGLDGVRALIEEIHSHKEFAPRRNRFCRNCVEYFECSATKPE